MYIRTPRGSARPYRQAMRGFGDLPTCSQNLPVGTQCVQPDQSPPAEGTSTKDWLAQFFGSGSSTQVPPTTTPTTTPTTPGTSTTGLIASVSNAIGSIFGNKQPTAPTVVSSGPSTMTIVAVGAVGLGAVYLLTRKKKGA